jgi:phosphatidylinositol alpha-1,6-mannosyltransferase
VPASTPNWAVHRLPVGRGLRWWVAPFVFPRAIQRIYAATGFDLLRVHSLRYVGPAALWARARYGLDVPVVAHHHHLDPSPLNGVVERRVIERADRIITVSEFSRRQLVQALGVDDANVDVVCNGIDDRFGPAPASPGLRERLGLPDGPVALFVGGLKPRKNVSWLIDLWREVARARADATLLIAGGGPLEATLRRRVQRLGLERRILFTGRFREADKPLLYNLADCFVSPSSLEGFGFTVGEAMSCGLPVVVSDQGALPELVVHGDGGFVCRLERPGEFVTALLRLLGDRELARRLGRFNRERIERAFRWERCVRAVRRIYEDVVDTWRRRPTRVAG